MLKLTLLVTAVLSFIHFWFPNSLDSVKKSGEDVLGIRQTNQALNLQTVKLATTSYCLSNNKLPENLNELYKSELREDRFLDLDSHFSLVEGKDFCEFEIVLKKA